MTSVSASSIYDFCQRAPELELVRIEVASPAFATFRRSIRRLIEILREDSESLARADLIQYSLLQWLTVPMPFESFELSPILGLGSPNAIATRWGDEARRNFVDASESFAELRPEPHPLRAEVEDALLNAAASCSSLKIYCHRSARGHFESLASWPDIRELTQVGFLGSPRDYRSTSPFEVMLKVGPLRSRGFSSVPGAVLNAPRFRKLIQVAWHGTPDQAGFGDDPVMERWTAPNEDTIRVASSSGVIGRGVFVRRTSSVVGDTTMRSDVDFAVVDDFSSGSGSRRSAGSRTAMLFHLADRLGSLQAPHADIICLGREGDNVFASRLEPSDIDDRITHLVDPALEQVDFGMQRASAGMYASRWKARLLDEYRRSPTALEGKLRSRGIRLDTLGSRIQDWIQPASNVIHAPQQRRHFETLIDVLGIESDAASYPRGRRLSWAAAAWAEISHSRGQAIQHGTERHEIIAEELKTLLNNEWMLFRDEVQSGSSFTWVIPSGLSLAGIVSLHAILEIEDGYRCPDQFLKHIEPIETLLPWRE